MKASTSTATSSQRLSVLANALGIALVMFALPASAATRVVVVAANAEALPIARKVQSTLALRTDLSVTSLDAVAATLPPPVEPLPATTADAVADALRGNVQRFYYLPDRVAAKAGLRRATDDALRLLGRLVERERLWNAIRHALLILASAAQDARDDAQASADCARVLDAEPDYEPPGRDFSPTLRRAFARLRDTRAASLQPLRIAGATGAVVFIDGRRRGVTPLSVLVTPRQHLVQGLEDGVLGVEVTVDGTGAIIDLFPYCETPRNLGRDRCRDRLRARSGAEMMIDVAANGGRVRIDAYRAGAAPRSGQGDIDARLDPAWVSGLAAFALGEREVMPPVTAVSGPPLYKRWWFWTVVGAAVAGAGAAAYLARPRGGLEVILQRGAGLP